MFRSMISGILDSYQSVIPNKDFALTMSMCDACGTYQLLNTASWPPAEPAGSMSTCIRCVVRNDSQYWML